MAATFNAPVPLLIVRATVSTTNPGTFTDLVTTRGLQVIDVVGNKGLAAGGAGDTIRVGNSASNITPAISLNVAANVSFRTTAVDTSVSTIASGGSIRVTVGFNTDNGCWAEIYCLPA